MSWSFRKRKDWDHKMAADPGAISRENPDGDRLPQPPAKEKLHFAGFVVPQGSDFKRELIPPGCRHPKSMKDQVHHMQHCEIVLDELAEIFLAARFSLFGQVQTSACIRALFLVQLLT